MLHIRVLPLPILQHPEKFPSEPQGINYRNDNTNLRCTLQQTHSKKTEKGEHRHVLSVPPFISSLYARDHNPQIPNIDFRQWFV